MHFQNSVLANRGRFERWKEALILVLAALSSVGVVAVAHRQSQFDEELAVSTFKRTNQARVQGFEQFVLRTIEAADLATRHIEANLKDYTSTRMSTEDDPVLNSKVFDGFVIRRPGQPTIESEGIHLPAAAIERLDELAGKTNEELIVTPPVTLGGDRHLVAVLRCLEDKKGYVAVLLEPGRFTDFAQDISFRPDDLISLIGLDGVTRARRTGDVLSSGEPVKGLVMERQLANPNGTYIGPSVLDGVPRIFSHRRLSKYALFATSGTPMSVVDERVAQRRSFQLIVEAAGIAAILSAAIAILVANRRRYRRLIEVEAMNNRLLEAQRIGSIGDWDYYPATDELVWSEVLKEMYGRTEEQSVSNLADVSRHVAPEDAARIQAEVEKVMAGHAEASWEIEAVLADGRSSTRRVVAVPIRDAAGQVIGIHGTDQDITHLRQARQMESRLVELARLESVNSLAATLAHELNQPLGVAANYIGAAQRSLEGGVERERVSDLLEASQVQIHHVAAIIDGARDLVNPGKGSAEEVSISDAIETALALLKGYSRRRIDYHLDISANLSSIWSSGAQLKQVLFNLMKNSLEAVPTSRVPKLAIKVRRVARNRSVQFDVTDNGTGITSVADPFAALATTKQTGLGLGLSLARTIVEAHGGKIWVADTSDNGTTISFTIHEGR